MPKLADLHNHALFGVDDGAKAIEMTEAMLAISYAQGVRVLCLTPHGDPSRFSCKTEKVEARFAAVKQLCREKFPALTLYLGHELFGHIGSVASLQSGHYRPLGNGNVVLAEFMPDVDYRGICNVFHSYRAAGYAPMLAHAERYACLLRDVGRVRELSRMRVLIQVNARTVCHNPWLSATGRFADKLLQEDLVDVVASDAHDTKRRPPDLLSAYRTVERRYGTERAKRLFFETPQRLLAGENRKEDL